MSKLVSPEGKILIPGIQDLVAPVTEDERKKFEAIHFGVQDIHAAVGGDQTLTDDKVTTLMGRMRNPSLSLHGIEGAFCTSLLLKMPCNHPKETLSACTCVEAVCGRARRGSEIVRILSRGSWIP